MDGRSIPYDELLLVSSMQPGEMPKPVGCIRAVEVKALLEMSMRHPLTWILVTDKDGEPVGGTYSVERWNKALEIRTNAMYN
jgi:hypothetical protein